jgi:hypothetical protein
VKLTSHLKEVSSQISKFIHSSVSLNSFIQFYTIFRLSPEIIELIKEKLDENCAITSGDLVIYVREEFDINVCLSTIDRAIGSFHYSVKRITHRALAGDTPQNVQARIDFANWYLDQQAAGKEFAWFDEVPFNLSMRVA